MAKTTLSRSIANDLNGVYFDLERHSDRLKLSDPKLALGALADRLVVLDEVQGTPGLFETLRPLIDEQRQPGRFLLLGSASPDLLQQASESLAKRQFLRLLFEGQPIHYRTSVIPACRAAPASNVIVFSQPACEARRSIRQSAKSALVALKVRKARIA